MSDFDFDEFESFPDMVVVSAMMECNARCPNCPFSPHNSAIRSESHPAIDVEVWNKIADEVGEHGSWLRVTGGGEPFMHPFGMAHLLGLAKAWRCKTWVNTNGSLLGPDVMWSLFDCGHDMLEISVDAGTERDYRTVRAGLSWSTLVMNVEQALAMRQRRYPHSATKIVVSIVEQQAMAGKLDEAEAFWRKLGVDNVLRRKFLTWGDQSVIDSRRSANPLPILENAGKAPCPYPFQRLHVLSNGHVAVCGYDISGRTDLGDLHDPDVTIKSIWHGEFMQTWRENHRRGEGHKNALCSTCTDWKYRSWSHGYRQSVAGAEQKLKEK